MRLNKRIGILEKTDERDEYGAIITNSFRRWKTAWASVIDKSGSEGLRGESAERIASVTTDFTIRNTTCARCGGKRAKRITPDMRIRFGGENYNIISVLEYTDSDRTITITAERDGFREAANQ